MAQWIRHQTSDLEIAGSSPVVVDHSFLVWTGFGEAVCQEDEEHVLLQPRYLIITICFPKTV